MGNETGNISGYSDDRRSITGYNFETEYSYTPVKVKNKDTGETFTIDMVNLKMKGNQAEWTVKDGKVYDKNGKTVQDNIIEVTRYQAEIIKAAAGAGDAASKQRLNVYDIVGAQFADKAEQALQNANSEFHITDADALEQGVFYAYVKNEKGEKGHLEIAFSKDENTPETTEKSAWQRFKEFFGF